MQRRGWLENAYFSPVDEVNWDDLSHAILKSLLIFATETLNVKTHNVRFPLPEGSPIWYQADNNNLPMPDKVKDWLVPCNGCDDLYPHVSAWTAESTEWRNESAQRVMAQLRRNGSEAYIYNNGIPIIDLPAVRTRSFFWQIWATNWPHDEGLQGSLSY